jgi:translation elongation factor EF-Tu-like GTPase
VPAGDDGPPFVLTVETAVRLTGRGTVIIGVIEQGGFRVGDHLEVIPPGGTGIEAPIRFRCADVDPAPRITDRDYAALGYPVVIFTGTDIDPDAIKPGATVRKQSGH